MLATLDLLLLSTWCSSRGVSWSPGLPERCAMLLEWRAGPQPCETVTLRREGRALRLLDGVGALLAEASTLPALLDAVDGGVAEVAR